MRRTAVRLLAGAMVAIQALTIYPGLASERDRHAARTARAQAEPKSSPPARLRVTPRYPYRTRSLPYPPPYDIEYPGPGFVRQCRSWLAPEYRPSGTVITPHMRCWWERG